MNEPWFIAAVPTGKIEFGVLNCPDRAHQFYHHFMKDHPELRKVRWLLFIPVNDNNSGAATISRWICNTIVESHAALCDSKTSQKQLKSIIGAQCRYLIAIIFKGRPAVCIESWQMDEVYFRDVYYALLARPLSSEGPTTQGWTLGSKLIGGGGQLNLQW